MAEKKAFVLRINPEMLKEIETWAAEEFRSTNGQVEYLLQQALLARKKGFKKKGKEIGD
ncbi:Arc family DNA binding domain-containing protein [Mucilaginibacter celer]|uniref:Arc family DNA binding domain-containing protein n=1 Tax=Mucilaginibacter celer TaxID=2305508 RepID=A0A494VYJ4_9SPHI|nr:Arc family DNA binding domain-containing protein [Mucilaginibacter celer]AYL96235.1 Arc family DNA binding domain-containing protein [Mucilaginibacter celer]